jgi:hypothetical protein
MATTTPNFGWPVPTSTDLVKDGAVAIEGLGDAIDASLLDLKGGTTGQVLAKASGTDMDFSWVAQDDSNAIQNAIVDAKGDLIAATANDTPARLAVGTDFGFLQALASETTGIRWNNAAWTSYTPTITATGGIFTTVSGTGKYTRIGKLCVTQITVTITTNGTATGEIRVTAPFTSSSSTGTSFVGTGRENQSVGFTVTARIGSGDSSFLIGKVDGSYPGGNSYTITATIPFEVA